MLMDEAKEIYFKYDCSLFVMAREENILYEEFKFLNIADTTLDEWKQEKFLSLWQQLKKSGSSNLFNRMYNLTENNHNRENLLILKEALYKVKYDSFKTNAYISEIILGRKVFSERSGMIFWAHDIGEHEIAMELIKFVIKLLDINTDNKNLISRCERDKQKCYLISSELNYVVPNNE